MRDTVQAFLITMIVILAVGGLVQLVSSGVFSDPSNSIPLPDVAWTSQGPMMVYDVAPLGQAPDFMSSREETSSD